MNRKFFKESGRLGGRKRARNLSPQRRSEIASRAARTRWKGRAVSPPDVMMTSVRFEIPRLDEPAYLEEVLLDGSLNDWSRIYDEISDHPFGTVAKALRIVLSSAHAYGVTPLWRGLLGSVQGVLL